MKVTIASIFPPDESPRYMFGKTATDEYVVFSPLATATDFHFDLDDLVKFEKVSQGPVEAINMTKNETIGVLIHDAGINKDIIRVRYDPQFR
ncbi:MAG: hypothetical protein ACNA74_03095 [Desulfurivibrio sp.]